MLSRKLKKAKPEPAYLSFEEFCVQGKTREQILRRGGDFPDIRDERLARWLRLRYRRLAAIVHRPASAENQNKTVRKILLELLFAFQAAEPNK